MQMHEPIDSEVLDEVAKLRGENSGAGIKTLYRLLKGNPPVRLAFVLRCMSHELS
jgi:hypothetical protein